MPKGLKSRPKAEREWGFDDIISYIIYLFAQTFMRIANANMQ